MKIVNLFCIIALCFAFNTHAMFRSTVIKRSVEQGVKKILSDEEKFFLRNQNELAMSNMRVNAKKEQFYKEQAEYTKYKKNVSGMLVGALLIIEAGHLVFWQ